MESQKIPAVGSVMVVGGGVAGIQASLDLANSGYSVYLVEKASAIGGTMSQLDKTFPTNDCSMCIISPKLVECGSHPNIQLLTLSELTALEGEAGNFTATVLQHPRYIDRTKCTGCGECASVCPVVLANEFDCGLSAKKAAYKRYPQAVPGTFTIEKLDRAPCVTTCPANITVQGYVQLIKMGKYPEAVKLIMEDLPMPGVLGRVCPHPCETACRRKEVDEPIAICNLKRFAADQVDLATLPILEVPKKEDKVAIIGSGPAGLSCAYQLARRGYRVTVFEALPVTGGMIRVGIPDYRLPKKVLDDEVNYITRWGVEIKTNTALGRDFSLDDLFAQGYKAVFLGLGCHVGSRMGIPGEDTAGVVQGVDLLRDLNLGKNPPVGKKMVVIGGGNVAFDVARSAKRLGSEVSILYRRTRAEMPANAEEIEEAECEHLPIEYLVAPKEVVVADGKAVGLKCIRMELGEPDASGRRRPIEVPGSEFVVDCDMIVPAIGQKANLKGLEGTGITTTKWGTLEVNEITYETSRQGVFAAGDVHTGPWIAIGAVAGGKEAAESIDRYLQGQDLAAGRGLSEETKAMRNWADIPLNEEKKPREVMPQLPHEVCCTCFDEVKKGYSEDQARAEAERCLNCGICSECMQCVVACPAQAVAHDQEPITHNLEVGSVILATGAQTYDPTQIQGVYLYGKHPNVITALEFERILSASGPFLGHMVRPSDKKEPRKIAWLQCVGSRNTNQCKNGYCSAVCCMYAIKEAVVAKEHSKEPLETTIFYMDMRTYGKDFEKYYNRAEREYGVQFVRCRVHTIEPAENDGLRIKYVNESGEPQSEYFDLVVLSVGLEVDPDTINLAKKLGLDLDHYNFAVTDVFAPVSTSRPGVYTCGLLKAPKDIPSAVTEASAAACAASVDLAEARGTRVKVRELPPELDVTGQPSRIGVFVCNCGINISSVVDVKEVSRYAETLPNVVFTGENLFTCSQDTQEKIRKVIEEEKLNRVVVAACTPRTHEPLFQATIRNSGLNKYLFEMANIRDQDSWVHQQEPVEATEKAKDLVRMAVGRANLLRPLIERPLEINPRGLIIGGGVAGLNAALNLANQGFEAIIVEKNPELGGLARRVQHTIEGVDVQAYLDSLIRQVKSHEKIQVLTEALVVGFKGFKGNFTTEVLVGPGMYQRKIEHGVTIVATGAREYRPKEYLYGDHKKVMTQLELGQVMEERSKDVAKWNRVAMIQCVGSRNEENPNCSRICCQSAVKHALELKELNPDMDIIILYRDMRTYGLLEDYYTAARNAGIIFARFDPEKAPELKVDGDTLSVTFIDHVLQKPVRMDLDALILSAATLAEDTEELASFLKVPRNADGFFIEAHAKLRPVDFASEGIYLCGTAHSPKLINESIAQALAATSRAAAFLSATNQTIGGVVAQVIKPESCAACLVCVRRCPYGVPQINREDVSEINEALCQGCGICASECPVKAIQLAHYDDDQIMVKLDALMEA
jgi:heterodisulfide reductase subunit A-like polyferredoxin